MVLFYHSDQQVWIQHVERIYRSAHHELFYLILLLPLLYDSTSTRLVVLLRKSTMTFILLRRIDPSSDLFYGKSLGSRKSTWWFLLALTTHIEIKYAIQMNGIFQLINNVIATGRVHLNISNEKHYCIQMNWIFQLINNSSYW